MPRILWADDEIDLLKPHVLFLEAKGYSVETVSNGADAVDRVENARFDVVFLDEQMPGLGGLDALEQIKERRPETPVVMITKSEEEHLMEDAIGRKIADYLIKPVHPKQLLLTCKRLLDGDRIRGEQVQQDYLQTFGQISARLGGSLDADEWIDVYRQLVRFDLELQGGDESVRQILDDQYKGANEAFSRFIEREYPEWISASARGEKPGEARPTMSHDIIGQSVMPLLGDVGGKPERPVVFFLIDCLRYDQWLLFERTLQQHYEVETDWHYSILPTATPYSRNAIFGGLLPVDLAKRFPDRFTADVRDDDEPSLNAHEDEFLRDLLDRRHRKDIRMRYEKISNQSDGAAFADRVTDLLQVDLSAVVVNFVDILAHSRSDSRILREIAPDVPAYRGLSTTWFEHSWLADAFKQLSEHDCTIVITSDHGAVRSLNATKVIGDRETSTSLRYKHGRNLKVESREAIFVKEPETYGLPRAGINENYVFATEDRYFVYPTNYHKYQERYRDSFLHGGVSLEEILLPVATLRPKG
ncbi:bifunctional response regulator/alkaline phosphatase family protein [Rubricoccus marinus]|uniref:Response regulator n=1 Tax=Rubricoccus marinus TaxID=716817 RepID=A0A259U253_9BACT|nr:bifunctional response regulator/alkaline phosphatase family protein [Rubricoccus marinus]OZC03917.1 response regulator [Rubricoccus marinus]